MGLVQSTTSLFTFSNHTQSQHQRRQPQATGSHASTLPPRCLRLSLTCSSPSDEADDTLDAESIPEKGAGVCCEKVHTSYDWQPPMYVGPPPISISSNSGVDDHAAAYAAFLKECPEYRLTWTLDALRQTEFARLEHTGLTYADYMGGALYPESLVRTHSALLQHSVLGNTHSASSSSQLSTSYAEEARASVLSFFHASPDDYTVIFTANASAALKLVGESYPFSSDSSFVLAEDSHNSVHGIRQFATRTGASVHYIPSKPYGGVDEANAKDVLRNGSYKPGSSRLFALTAQSNISNSKNPLYLASFAQNLGYHVVLDAAAFASTSVLSLTETPVDAVAVSFYKMFGFPTGVGALIARKSFLKVLKRPWFAGGTVDIVQVPGSRICLAPALNEQFEDGTINYLNLPAVTDGLRLLSAFMPFLPLRLSSLVHYLSGALSRLRHPLTDAPVVKILSQLPARRVKRVGEQSDTGSTLSMLFLDSHGDMFPLSFVEFAAQRRKIALRTGCMCNPGGASALLGLGDHMVLLTDLEGVTLHDFEARVGRELGVVRISLGLASNFRDAWNIFKFAEEMADERLREELWAEWRKEKEATV